MGSGFSHLIPCLKPEYNHHNNHHHNKSFDSSNNHQDPVVFAAEQPLDETLGHSFCYVRSSARFLSPTSSDHFLSPSHSLRFDDRSDPTRQPSRVGGPETGFRTISGASVSANTSTPRTVEVETAVYGSGSIVNGFDCTSSFSALPLQPVPRGDSSGFFLSGPIERGALSGPLDSGPDTGRVPFSAPLGGAYKKKKRKKSLKKLYRSFSEKKRQWVVPVVGRKESSEEEVGRRREKEVEDDVEGSNVNVQWALGKAGEDRVHVVVSEEHGWLFVGIYDGFNGPDAPEFLMGHLYRAVFGELKGLFWDSEEDDDGVVLEQKVENHSEIEGEIVNVDSGEGENRAGEERGGGGAVKRVTFEAGLDKKEIIRRKLWEFLAEDDAEDGLDLSGSDRFAFSVDDAVSVSNAGSAVGRRSLLLSKLKQGLTRSKEGHSRGLFQWRFGVEEKDKVDDVENRVEERSCRSGRRRKTGPVDHDLVLRALSRALEKTEQAYLDLTDKVLDRYPELALMGSCLLVVLMRDEDVYVMNLGDSRAIVAQLEPQESCSNVGLKEKAECGSSTEGIVEECTASGEKLSNVDDEFPLEAMKLTALQLTIDHSTSVEEEVLRIKREHPDDKHCIVNDRVKGRLKVTRAFGAGFLKQAKFNDSLLEMFRNEFIGSAPYVSCIPSLRHHKLGRRDQFLVLSSDGLYQYFSNQDVVSFVENFLEKFPDGDPAQHLIEELLNRAAKKAGMDFHDLLDIPQGDRRKYHDDVTVMVVSLEGRIWKSSGKYP
ncbi:protein phosphatase 2C 29-like [Chenopodium quinoa]|uniref:protein phosphatase 2C 29-like n=1 Tax=Chenopodium quinoa TaxID=63459 RepID=UPI000B76BDCB|nr:protein phosphatase 2C 29-like [Chenopodium quinoa]